MVSAVMVAVGRREGLQVEPEINIVLTSGSRLVGRSNMASAVVDTSDLASRGRILANSGRVLPSIPPVT